MYNIFLIINYFITYKNIINFNDNMSNWLNLLYLSLTDGSINIFIINQYYYIGVNII